MKTGRNEPCPCGIGKKHKHCCLAELSSRQAEILEHAEQVMALNPHLTADEISAVMQHKIDQRNHQVEPDFCGLTPAQLDNWLHAPFDQLAGIMVATPDDLSASPVMRYLGLIIDEALAGDGAFKATATGNLPAKLAKQASALLPEFAIARYDTEPSISAFCGNNENHFEALYYTRVLAELSSIIYRRSGRYHPKKTALKQYQQDGLKAFFIPMLEAAIYRFNWNHLDGYAEAPELQSFFWFMLWRLHTHQSLGQLNMEMLQAFPSLIEVFPEKQYFTPQQQLESAIRARLVNRLLEFWGFVVMDPAYAYGRAERGKPVEIQPLFKHTFGFAV